MTTVFVYVEKLPAALDTSAVVYWIDNKYLEDRDRLKTSTVDYLNKLEVSGALKYNHFFIPVDRINHYGYNKAVRDYLEEQIPYTLNLYKIKADTFIRSANTPPSYYYPLAPKGFRKEPGLWVGEKIAKSKRKWWIKNFWHRRCPEYGWDRNLGKMTLDHTLKSLEFGIHPDLHYKWFQKKILLLALKLVKVHNPDLMLNTDLCLKTLEQVQLLLDIKNKEHSLELEITKEDMKIIRALKMRLEPPQLPAFKQKIESELKEFIPEYYVPLL